MPTLTSIRIPMRDGVALTGDVYLPAQSGSYPVLFTATPYNRQGFADHPKEVRFWNDNGYAFVAVDTRGSYESEGETGFFAPDIDDNYDAIEWLAAQPWSNGKIGMSGVSYSGTNQWMAAKNAPPHLRCIVPSGSVGRFMEELPRNGGAFKSRWALEWLQLLKTDGKLGPPVDDATLLSHRPLRTVDELVTGRAIATFRDFVDHDTLDDYWRTIQFTEGDFERIDIPTLAFSGWFDGTLPGTLFYYQNMRRLSPSRERQYVVIGPWQHSSVRAGGLHPDTDEPVTAVGDLIFPPTAFLDGNQITLAFYDWCLKDGPQFDQPSARMFVTGSNIWIDLPTYPHPDADLRKLYLTTGPHGVRKGLSWTVPGDEPADFFVYDPRDPVPEYVIRDGARCRLQSMPVDITQVQDRRDVLVYETEPLSEPLTIVGNVRLELIAASDAPDTDFTSHIADVLPDGRAIKLGPQSGAVIRARYRDGYDRPRLLEPGMPTAFSLDYFDIGHTFLPGHRLRISVTSSNFPWVSANPNTGNPIGSDTAEPRIAHQAIYHDRLHASHLLLPVIPAQVP